MPEIKRIEIKIDLAALSSVAQAKEWTRRRSFLDGCTDADHRWFFDGDKSAWLVLAILPSQIARVITESHKLFDRYNTAHPLDIELSIKAALAVELSAIKVLSL